MKAPQHLQTAGRAAYRAVFNAGEADLIPDVDYLLVQRLGELVDERARLRQALEADGDIQHEVIQNATGEVIGERLVPHPALAALRALDRALDSVSDQLGLSPQSRRKLGVSADGNVWAE